jgi:hypothetical protein
MSRKEFLIYNPFGCPTHRLKEYVSTGIRKDEYLVSTSESTTPLLHSTSFNMDTSQIKDDKSPVTVQDFADFSYTNEEEQVSGAIDEAYLTASWFTKFYRGVLFQMILFGA